MTEMGNELSLVGCMKEVPDPRAPYNQRHKFLDIIIIAVTAILCGMDTWNEIEDWAYSKRMAGNISGTSRRDSSHDTINRVFQMIDPDQFHDAFFGGPVQLRGKSKELLPLTGKPSAAVKMKAKEIVPPMW